jgi:hypothetical protein
LSSFSGFCLILSIFDFFLDSWVILLIPLLFGFFLWSRDFRYLLSIGFSFYSSEKLSRVTLNLIVIIKSTPWNIVAIYQSLNFSSLVTLSILLSQGLIQGKNRKICPAIDYFLETVNCFLYFHQYSASQMVNQTLTNIHISLGMWNMR